MKKSFDFDLECLKKVGSGTYGKVFKALNKLNGHIVALKQIILPNDRDDVPFSVLREICSLKKLNHINVVTLLDYRLQTGSIELVFEFFDRNLKEFISSFPNAIEEKIVWSVTEQLFEALHHCHSRGVFHRDIKPQNILIDDNGVIKLADFGLVRTMNYIDSRRDITQEMVTLWYRSPEILLGSKNYDYSTDVWSVGCIIAEFLIKKPLFQGDSQIDQIFKIFEILGTPSQTHKKNLTFLPYFKESFPKFEGNLKLIEEKMQPKPSEELLGFLKTILDMDFENRPLAYEGLLFSRRNNVKFN